MSRIHLILVSILFLLPIITAQYTCDPVCQNNGKCLIRNSCNCEGTGYAGKRCEVPICDPVCFAGKCIGPNQCNCTGTGYTGPRCETITCEKGCQHGQCVGANQCKCDEGYIGDACEIPLCDPGCLNGGECVSPNKCDCSKLNGGWVGPICETPVCDVCYHNTTCVGPNVCNCTGTGWAGQRCEVDVIECRNKNSSIQLCDPQTKCVNTPGSYTCTPCPSGYTGEGKTGCVPLCEYGCDNGGVCTGPNTCDCTGTGYTGSTCFQDINECQLEGYCDPSSICINTLGSFKCISSA